MSGLARRTGLALMAALLLGPWVQRAAAQDATEEASAPPTAVRTPTRRAVIFVDAEEGVDPFARVYLYEVLAGQLREHGFAVVSGDLAAEPTPPLECLAERPCTDALLGRLTAPLVVALHLARGASALALSGRRSDAPDAPLALSGDEGALATALVQALASLDPAAVPCLVTLASEVPGAALEVAGRPSPLPAVLAPGEHAARALAPSRGSWEGLLRCTGGRVLRVRVE